MRRTLLSAMLLLAGAVRAEAPFSFVDATAGSGIDYRTVSGAAGDDKGWITETMGTGVAWLDYDNDGHLDLYFVNGSTHERGAEPGEPNRLFRGNGRGRFKDVTAASGAGDRGWGYGVTVGDYDNDGSSDIYVTNLGANVLLHNRGDGTFEDVTAAAGVGDPSWGVSTAFFDMDNDGDLDLYVANYLDFDVRRIPRRGPDANLPSCRFKNMDVVCGPLGLPRAQDVVYRNNGDGTFTDVTRASGFYLRTPRYSMGVMTADYDNDGDQDVYVTNDSVPNSLWRNKGGGSFEEVGLATLSALDINGNPQAGMGLDFGDFDADGWLDLVVTNFSHDINTIYRNEDGLYFMDASNDLGMGVTDMALSWATAFRDFDRDGDLDLFIANGHVYAQIDDADLGTTYRQANHLFRNDGSRFTEVSASSGPGLAVARSFRGAAFGDYDEDGDVDVVLTAMDEAALLLRNETLPKRRWLEVELTGTASNRDAVGARVRVTAGGRTQIRELGGGGSYLSASSRLLHFGLGDAKQAEELEVRWPSGRRSVLRDVKTDRRVEISEPVSPARPSPARATPPSENR